MQSQIEIKTCAEDMVEFVSRQEDLKRYIFNGLLTEVERTNLSNKLRHEFTDRIFEQDNYQFQTPQELLTFLYRVNSFNAKKITEEVIHESEHFNEAKLLGLNPHVGVWLLKTRDVKGKGFYTYTGFNANAEQALKITSIVTNKSPFDKLSLGI